MKLPVVAGDAVLRPVIVPCNIPFDVVGVKLPEIAKFVVPLLPSRNPVKLSVPLLVLAAIEPITKGAAGLVAYSGPL